MPPPSLQSHDPRTTPPTLPHTTLRVCIVTEEINGPWHNGGIGTAYTALAEALAEAGHAVTVLYLAGKFSHRRSFHYWQQHYHTRGIELVALPESSTPLGGGEHLAKSYRAYQWLRHHAFDVIHFHEWLGGGYYSLLARHQGLAFADTTLCVGVHSPTLWIKQANQTFLNHLDDLERDAVERKCVELADVIWSPSQYLLDWLQDNGWRAPVNAVVLPYLVPSTVGNRGTPDHEPREVSELVFFGRLEMRKGLVLFCDALDQLEGDAPAAVTFLGKPVQVAGQDARSYLRQRSGRWAFPCRILDRCDHPEALDYLRGDGRVAVMPSLMDNSPLTVLECLQAGIPFLASRVGGIPELLAEEDRDSLLFAAQPRALAQRLGQVLRRGARPGRSTVDPQANRRAWLDWHNLHLRQTQRQPASSAERSPPLVSVCLTHFNRPEMLRQALDSLRAQDYPNFEVVLVDDGSTTREAQAFLHELEWELDQRGWQLLRQENRYLGAARNLAARHARGQYLLFMDDDNYAKPHELRTLVAVAERTGAEIVTTFMDFFEGPDAPGKGQSAHCRWLFAGTDAPLVGIGRNCFGDANALVRRDAFETLGGFTEEQGVTHEDWELFARAVLRGFRLEVVPEALFWYRCTPDSMIRTTSAYANYARHLRPYLEEVPEPYRDLVRLAQGQVLRNLELEQQLAKLSSFRYRFVDRLNDLVKRVPFLHRIACRLVGGRR